MSIKEYREKLQAEIVYERQLLEEDNWIPPKGWTLAKQRAFIGGLERAEEMLVDTF